MLNVYWLEQTEADVPTVDDWLSGSEAVRLDGMRIAKRRTDWRLGRWTAKRALAITLNLPSHIEALAAIEIRPAPSGAPEAFLADQPVAVPISLSHRAGAAICAVAPSGAALGCDLEVIEPRGNSFVTDYFTSEEQALVERASASDRTRLLTLLWSGKESALKALGMGLQLDTRSVTVDLVDELLHQGGGGGYIKDTGLTFPPSYGLTSWQPLHVRHADGQDFFGWWRYSGSLVRTLVASPQPASPILLERPDSELRKPHFPAAVLPSSRA